MIKFIKQFILASITWLLKPIVHIATFIVVLFKYGKGAFDYFDNMGYEEDVRSASENRTLWNFLLLKKNGIMFKKGTTKSISRYIGINYYIKTLSVFGYFIYYILYAIDYTAWHKNGHCKNAVKLEDWVLIFEKL